MLCRWVGRKSTASKPLVGDLDASKFPNMWMSRYLDVSKNFDVQALASIYFYQIFSEILTFIHGFSTTKRFSTFIRCCGHTHLMLYYACMYAGKQAWLPGLFAGLLTSVLACMHLLAWLLNCLLALLHGLKVDWVFYCLLGCSVLVLDLVWLSFFFPGHVLGKICSTSPSRGNQVDGLPRASSDSQSIFPVL